MVWVINPLQVFVKFQKLCDCGMFAFVESTSPARTPYFLLMFNDCFNRGLTVWAGIDRKLCRKDDLSTLGFARRKVLSTQGVFMSLSCLLREVDREDLALFVHWKKWPMGMDASVLVYVEVTRWLGLRASF